MGIVGVCFACWSGRLFVDLWVVKSRGDADVPRFPIWGVKQGVRPSVSDRRSYACLIPFIRFCILLHMWRIGEAHNPGPDVEQQHWTLGICNPSGLNSKTDQCAFLDGDVWLISESHLTEHGLHRFKKGMQHLKSDFRYFVSGAPCPPRGASDVGKFTGVLAMSKLPLRALPTNFDSQLFATARIQVVGIAVADWWLTAGMIYGYPDSAQYPNRSYMTSCLMDAVIQRVVFQTTGPRLIAGDFNHGPQDLEQFSVLQQAGFREIQDLGLHRWGRRVQATCSGPKNIDQMWLSPELQALLINYWIRDDDWAGHSSIQCAFASQNTALVRYEWHVPSKLEWPPKWNPQLHCEWNKDLTEQYASLWYQLESQATEYVHHKGQQIPQHKLGRAQTLHSVPKWSSGAPCRKAREGGLNPEFFGHSLKHCQLFKQLRRLEALKKMIHSNSTQPLHHVKKVELWQAIRNAAGFHQGFCFWWSEHSTSNLVHLPIPLPTPTEAIDLFDQFQAFVRDFEAKLIRCRVAEAKQRRQQDLNMVFRDCQQAKPEKVDTLVISQTAEVAEIREDDMSIVLTQPCTLAMDLPAVCNGSCLSIIVADHDQVWVDNLDNITVGDTIRQDRILSTDHDILQEFTKVWTPRWQKASHVLDSQWEQIMGFTTRAFSPIPWQCDVWTPQKVQSTLKQKKASAATGPDGVSRHDLMSLPETGYQALSDMFTAIESQQAWPLQLTRGFVNSLFKNKGSGNVDSYRPVTVYPLPYRLWSSMRAKEAMQSLVPHLPRSVVGGVPNRQAKEVWIELAEVIESAITHNQPIQGLVVDICRAFNCLPRLPLWHLLRTLQFPEHLLCTWAHFVSVQTRMFRVRRSTGEPIGSNVGYPEGCAFSVFAMLLIDMMLDRWLHYATHGNHCLYAYVDDWHVTFPPPMDHGEVWHSLSTFASALDLQVDEDKSYLWASHPTSRKEMRQGSDLAVVLSAKNLGAHHNFCRRPGNAHLIARLQAMPQLWTRLSVCQSPIRFKLQALVQMAWPKAFYGVSVVNVGECHFKVLRTGAVRGLRCGRVGTNPLLHLTAVGFLHDPEAFVLYQTFREFREVGNVSQAKQMLSFLHSDCVEVPRNGPGHILWTRIKRLGWQITSEGGVVDTIGPFCVFGAHREELLFRIGHAWPRVLAAEVHHRPSYAGIQRADLPALKLALRKFGEADREFVKCALDGTLYIDIGRSKQEREGPRVCQYCSQPDSFYHRLWECTHFASCRQQFPFHSLLPDLPACLTNHGWPVYPQVWLALLDYFADIQMQCQVKFPVHSTDQQVLDFFTDGACAHPKSPKLRFASYAVTFADKGVGNLEHVVVGAGHVPGIIQTAYRAELCAMIRAFEVISQLQKPARVWTDNLSVCRRTRRILNGWIPKSNMAHSDLLNRLHELTAEFNLGSQITVIKVVSHASLWAAEDELQHWAFWHNHLVDFAAERVNWMRPSSFWTLWHEAAAAIKFSEQLHYEILRVIVRIGRHQSAKGVGSAYVEPEVTNTISSSLAPVESPQTMSPSLVKMYGQLNMQMLDKWWTSIGESALRKGGQLYWVAGISLYIDFFWTTNFLGLISPKFGQWYSDPSDIPDLALNFSSRTTMFLRAWNAYMKDRSQYVPRKLVRPRSSVFACWLQSYQLPWRCSRLDAIDRALMNQQIAKGVQLSELTSLPKHPEETDF